VPLEAWLSERLPEFFHDMLGEASVWPTSASARQRFDRLMISTHGKRRPDHCRRLWALAVLDRALHRLPDAGAA